ncbi:MAG: tripartite tricarboxylate transporter substrate binding protein [Acetobacteraceae bacterium]|nr:tripartite tricarboxylate transporter substrate binding protein [Acetobacteraceae bacterium]
MPRLPRRTLLAGLAVAAAQPARAQPAAWPSRPIRLLVPFPGGGAADVVARLVAAQLSAALGATVVVENRPGGSTVIAAEAAARAAPDGYTLLFASGATMSSVPALLPSIPYDPARDFAPIALISRLPFFIFVPARLEATDLGGLIALARARPGGISYGTNGIGTIGHLGMELLSRAAGVEMVHVPYRAFGPALTDMLAGRVQVIMGDLTVMGGALRAGEIRALAAALPERSGFLPEVPTVAEVAGLPEFDASAWFALFAAAAVPQPIRQRLTEAMLAWLATAEAREALGRIGQVPLGGGPDPLRALIESERARFGQVIREAGIRLE